MPTSTTIELDEALHSRVRSLASDRGQAIDAFVHDSLSEIVCGEEERASFHADASRAWRDHQADGLHATFEEVDQWLARLEAGEDAAPPECHG